MPATRDFRLTATCLAGRLSGSKNTVPDISPSVFSKLDTCARATGTQAMAMILRSRMRFRGRIGGKLTRGFDFLTSGDTHSISTCCALLRHILGGLDD